VRTNGVAREVKKGGETGAEPTEGGWNANDEPLVRNQLLQVDLVTGRVLNQHIKVGQGIADLDKGTGRSVKGAGGGDLGQSRTAKGEGSHVKLLMRVGCGYGICAPRRIDEIGEREKDCVYRVRVCACEAKAQMPFGC
jgi:hypothetical protein